MGITCKPCGKLKGMYQKIDNENEKAAAEARKSSKKKEDK